MEDCGYRLSYKFTSPDVCPKCGSENIEVIGGELALADGQDVEELVCHDCKVEWTERSDGFIRIKE